MQFCANLISDSCSCSGDFIITEELMGERGTSHFGKNMGGIPHAELRVLLGEGDSAGSLAATQLLLALLRGRRQSLWGWALKSEHGKTHFLCNLISR